MPNTESEMHNSVEKLVGCLIKYNVTVDTALVNIANDRHTNISLFMESFTSSPNLPNWVRN